MRLIAGIFEAFGAFARKMQRDAVAAYAAQAALFMIISAFPLAMLLISLIQYIPFINVTELQNLIKVLPSSAESFFGKIIDEVYSDTSVTVISLSAVVLLWSAARSMLSIHYGLNAVYDTDEKRNYFLVRGIASIYTFGFILLIIFVLALLVFGNSLLDLISRRLPSFYGAALLVMSFRKVVMFILLTLFFLLIYIVMPNRHGTIVTELPGAVISSLGWMVFSGIYGWYIDRIAANSYVYGSLSAVIFVMVWLYFCMYILFVGGEINCILRHAGFRLLRKKRRRQKQAEITENK